MALLLSACHPSYTMNQTTHYAHKLGVADQFDISRQNSRVLAIQSRISVVSKQVDGIDENKLSRIIAKSFSPHFDQTNYGPEVDSFAAGLEYAKGEQSDFLIFVSFQKEPSTLFGTFSSAHLLLSIVDVYTGTSVDKIKLIAKTPHWNPVGNKLNNLLDSALGNLAADISGHAF